METKKIIGLEFDHFGRRLGLRILPKHPKLGLNLVLHPVSIFRYFEFAFACGNVPKEANTCLDISSPRLFSLYVASNEDDLTTTRAIVSALELRNVTCEIGVTQLSKLSFPRYDCIWSLSVIEHITGEYDDIWAIQSMYDALRPGGCLILTVPVDRSHWEEYRERDYYGTQEAGDNGRYFFHRYYDEASIEKRLLEPIGQPRVHKQWFGERVEGHFSKYEAHWMQQGLPYVVNDPREIADHYQEYGSWGAMLGRGVCGITIVKRDK